MNRNLEMGEQGEQVAVDFLLGQGCRILERRFRRKTGEIDIIAKQGSTFLFVEVKTRRSTLFGTPSEAVTYKKQTKIVHTALQYLSYTRNENAAFRFDIIEVIMLPGKITVNYIPNAFGQ